MSQGKIFIAAAALALTATAPAAASVVYDNGPANGMLNAFTVNYGFAIADSFTLGAATTLTRLDFSLWAQAGDSLDSITWGIYDADPFSGGTLLAGGSADATVTPLFTNIWSYQISRNAIALAGATLDAGTYWLELSQAVTANGSPTYWDENNGPSAATSSAMGSLAGYNIPGTTGSESFRLFDGAVPEPASWALMIVGFGAVGGVLRSRRSPRIRIAVTA